MKAFDKWYDTYYHNWDERDTVAETAWKAALEWVLPLINCDVHDTSDIVNDIKKELNDN